MFALLRQVLHLLIDFVLITDHSAITTRFFFHSHVKSDKAGTLGSVLSVSTCLLFFGFSFHRRLSMAYVYQNLDFSSIFLKFDFFFSISLVKMFQGLRLFPHLRQFRTLEYVCTSKYICSYKVTKQYKV